MANWTGGLTRIYIVVWVVSAGAGLVAVGFDVNETVHAVGTVRRYVSTHQVTVEALTQVANPVGQMYPYPGPTPSPDVMEYLQAAEAAQSGGANPVGHVAKSFGLWVLLAAVLPAAVLWTLRWIAAGFKA